MRSLSSLCLALLTGALVALAAPPVRADVDVAGVVHLGSGFGTEHSDPNPYVFQLGAALELVLFDVVLGARITQSLASWSGCSHPVPACERYAPGAMRTVGGDVGYEWALSIVHVSPRLGFGRVRGEAPVLGDSDFKAAYLEPGAVADVQLGWFLAGVDLRYRIVLGESYANGLMGFARLGLRF